MTIGVALVLGFMWIYGCVFLGLGLKEMAKAMIEVCKTMRGKP